MRNMSFAMTTEQVIHHQKDVTRRFSWWDLEPGALLQPVLKTMGLQEGEEIKKLCGPIRILSTHVEPLMAITADDCPREGFPDMTPFQFVQMIQQHYGCEATKPVNRIEFSYVMSTGTTPDWQFCTDDDVVAGALDVLRGEKYCSEKMIRQRLRVSLVRAAHVVDLLVDRGHCGHWDANGIRKMLNADRVGTLGR